MLAVEHSWPTAFLGDCQSCVVVLLVDHLTAMVIVCDCFWGTSVVLMGVRICLGVLETGRGVYGCRKVDGLASSESLELGPTNPSPGQPPSPYFPGLLNRYLLFPSRNPSILEKDISIILMTILFDRCSWMNDYISRFLRY